MLRLYLSSQSLDSIFKSYNLYQGFPHSSVGKESACNEEYPSSIPWSGTSVGEEIGYPPQYSWASLVAKLIKNPTAMQETWVWSLGWDDTMEKGKAIHSSVLTWRISGVPDVQAGFRKGRGTRDQITNIHWIREKAKEFQKSIYFCFIDYTKAFDCVDHNKWCTILQEMGVPDLFTCLLRNLYAGQNTTFRIGHGTTDWLQIRKVCIKVAYCHPAYLTYMQCTSCEVPGWMNHKLGSRLLREISITLDMQIMPLLW